MSGMIVERRDQVLMTRFSLRELRSSTFFSRWSSTKGPFFRLRGMCLLPPGAAGTAAADDRASADGLVRVPGAALGLAPRRHRVAAARGLALAAAERVVDRVHGHAAGLGADALPAVAAGLADRRSARPRRCRPRRGWPGSRSGPGASRWTAAAGWRSRPPWPPAARSCRRRGPSCRRRRACSSTLWTTEPTGM